MTKTFATAESSLPHTTFCSIGKRHPQFCTLSTIESLSRITRVSGWRGITGDAWPSARVPVEFLQATAVTAPPSSTALRTMPTEQGVPLCGVAKTANLKQHHPRQARARTDCPPRQYVGGRPADA